ncbi:MAG: cysteine dioxygenase, partial [Myxococcaceae bacterium]
MKPLIVEDLVEALEELVPKGPERVQSALLGASIRPASLQPYLFFRPGQYTRNLIQRTEDFELLCLCWDAGTRSAVHDHSGEECFFLVHHGSFRVDNFALLEGGKGPGYALLEHEGTLLNVGPRMVDHRSSTADIHRVSVMPGMGRAVSLHVYAKPIDRCLVYDVPNRRCGWAYSRYHSVGGQWHA